jgi:hypothetical protein
MYDTEYYYSTAASDYENSDDSEYHFCKSNNHRFLMIKDYALWLYTMNESIRIWE